MRRPGQVLQTRSQTVSHLHNQGIRSTVPERENYLSRKPYSRCINRASVWRSLCQSSSLNGELLPLQPPSPLPPSRSAQVTLPEKIFRLCRHSTICSPSTAVVTRMIFL